MHTIVNFAEGMHRGAGAITQYMLTIAPHRTTHPAIPGGAKVRRKNPVRDPWATPSPRS